MSGSFRAGDRITARFKGEWFNAEIIRIEREGDYLVRWVTTPGGRPEGRSKTESRPAVSVVDPEDNSPYDEKPGSL